MPLHHNVKQVTDRIRHRSQALRAAYLRRVESAAGEGAARGRVSCTNLAHVAAAAPGDDKFKLREQRLPNLAIVSSYNDMLSAHQPYERYPTLIRAAARRAGATAQVAGGVPAMCDGVTQGQPGMELSLFSRDIIAMSTAVALSHNVFDGVLCLGVCDKIVPGLLMGALQFGHLPAIFVPAGPMATGLSNKEKAQVRQRHAQGLVDREELLESEMRSYHGPGTCTFYGTANSNQLLMEIMGLHLPGSAFVSPDTPLRDALTAAAASRAAQISRLGLDGQGREYTPLAQVIDERAIVNGIVGLLATGGSTNHTIHLVAIARAAGIVIDWDDFDALSAVVPLLARIYPNGAADINHFHAAGGTGFLIRELLDVGLLHDDVRTVAGEGLRHYTGEPFLDGERLVWRPAPATSGDAAVLRPADAAFSADGGLRLLRGNLGRAVIKVSAVAEEHRSVTAPAAVFDSQEALIAAYRAGTLDRDFIAVLRFQGPRANGMPELHQLMPVLGALQDAGRRVALVTDGRLSGASGKVPAAIHVWPEAIAQGPISRLRDGDLLRLDAAQGQLEALVPAEEWAARVPAALPAPPDAADSGRALLGWARRLAGDAERGGMIADPFIDPTHEGDLA
ncbi:phosphogluconate dehydratase [Solimonas sp. SE-A11]|uniref:phosphogluconate dehydratase n=1 Tax=Solimonas sp. SE-A11 TaxID=3054954 RepID=UPI00259C92DE|nr:phosphogluconate dehydratase [Solimonas sp. SE-A11]MDM4769874.1 phosphogluconate dehydratase [Solimonas sp. SE-A11]